MSRYRVETRTALVALLKTVPGLSGLVYSNPPTNLKGQLVLVGDIVFDAPEIKGSPASFYNANVEIWSHTFSPAEVDAIADNIVTGIDQQKLISAGRTFSPIEYDGEQVIPPPQTDAGGPVFGRVLSFRFYVQ